MHRHYPVQGSSTSCAHQHELRPPAVSSEWPAAAHLLQATCCSEPGQKQHGLQQSLGTRLVVPVGCSQPTFYLRPAGVLLVAALCRRLWLLGTTRLHSVSCQCHRQQRFMLRLLHEQ